jgi:hypothetical protein
VQVALKGPLWARPCRQSSCRPSNPNSSQPGRLPPSGSQLRRLLSLATGEQRRLTLRSRADPPRQGTLAAQPSMSIIGRAAKAPCLYGPLSSNVRRRKLEVLHGRRNYALACRPERPAGQASSTSAHCPDIDRALVLGCSEKPEFESRAGLCPSTPRALAGFTRSWRLKARFWARPCRQSSGRPSNSKASQPVRLPRSSPQLQRLPSLAT